MLGFTWKVDEHIFYVFTEAMMKTSRRMGFNMAIVDMSLKISPPLQVDISSLNNNAPLTILRPVISGIISMVVKKI